jgi:Mg-chelatase subunit ChlD
MSERSRHYVHITSLAILLVVLCLLLGLTALYARAHHELKQLRRQPREVVIEAEPVNLALLHALDDMSNQWRGAVAARDAWSAEHARLQMILAGMSNDVTRALGELARLWARWQALEASNHAPAAMAAAQSDTVTVTRTVSILGIPMRERKIAFLLDNSGSMLEEGRFAEVRGAMKVVLRSLDPSHKVDVMTFTTADDRTPVLQPLWGSLQGFGAAQREAAVQFLMNMTPRNGTPTVGAVSNALARYADVEAVVLLSDGEPTDYDPYGVEWERAAAAIEQLNTRRVPIYTIGVGPRMRSERHAGRRFMERVALMSHAASSSF